MIPYMSVKQRIMAWLIFKLEHFDNAQQEECRLMRYPENLRCVVLLRDRYYIKHAKEADHE